MKPKRLFLLAACWLIPAAALAGQGPQPVVALHYTVLQNDPEQLLKTVTGPVERHLRKLDQVTELNSSTSHGVVDVEIGFPAGATAQDLAKVSAHLDQLRLDDAVAVLSHTLEIRQPRLASADPGKQAMNDGLQEVLVNQTEIRTALGTVQTPAELITLLRTHDVHKVKLTSLRNTGYETIGKIIYGLVGAGIDIELSERAAE